MSRVHIDRFSAGLDDLTRKQQGDHVAVMRALSKMTRYSVFEASENDSIARTMTYIVKAGLIRCTGGAYPWTTFEITEAGRAILEPVGTHKDAP